MFDAAPNPYVVLDRDLTIVGMNEAYLRVTYSRRDGLVGKNMFVAFPSDPASESGRLLRDSFARVLREKSPDSIALIPYEIRDAAGQPVLRYWSATHTPLFDDNGDVAFILQHTTDVTELERLRAESRASAEGQGMLDRAGAVQAQNLQLNEERSWLRRLFEQAPSFMAVLRGPDHVFDLANASYHQITGHRPLIGRPVAEALPEVVDQGFVTLLDNVRHTGVPFIGKAVPLNLQTAPDSPPEPRVLDFIYQPLFDAKGAVSGIFVQGHDITEQKQAEAALARQSDFLRLAQDAGAVGTFDFDLQTGLVKGSQTFFDLYGLKAEPEGIPITVIADQVLPEDRDKLSNSTARPIEESVGRTEYRTSTPSGVRWIARKGELVRDADGTPLRVIGAAYDITDRKEAEAQMRLLMGEAAHRMKNMLTLVNAVVSQTLRNTPSIDAARESIEARLQAISRAQDALMQSQWGSADINEVVGNAIALHGAAQRFTVTGPTMIVSPKAVLGLGLMLHELMTNALKYGALSVPEGKVAISWALRPEDDALQFEWREFGGPPVVMPERKGFGSRLIERGLAGNFGGSVTLDYAVEGLTCYAVIATDTAKP